MSQPWYTQKIFLADLPNQEIILCISGHNTLVKDTFVSLVAGAAREDPLWVETFIMSKSVFILIEHDGTAYQGNNEEHSEKVGITLIYIIKNILWHACKT